jgi:hypothetical protein
VVSACYGLSYALSLIIKGKTDDGIQAMIYVINKQMPKSETEFLAIIHKIMQALAIRLTDNVKCIIRGGDIMNSEQLENNCKSVLDICSALKPDADSELQQAVNDIIDILNISKGFDGVRKEIIQIKTKLQLHQYEAYNPISAELCKVCDNVANG